MRNSFYYANGKHVDETEIKHDFMDCRDISYLSQVIPMIEEFTEEGDTILEPFCGMGTTVIAAGILGRKSIGIEIEPERFENLKNHIKKFEQTLKCYPDIICGDSLRVSFPKDVDAVITNVPYYGTRTSSSGDSNNFYNQKSYFTYLELMENVIKKCSESLKRKGYMIVFCENIRDLNGDMIPQAFDICKIMQKYFHIKDERIVLYEKESDTNNHLTSRAHEYIFIGKKKDAADDLKELKAIAKTLTTQTDCRLIGSLGIYLECPQVLDTVPSDVDLYARNTIENIKNIIAQMQKMNMTVYSWQDIIDDNFNYDLLKGRFYVRGIKGDKKVDVTYEIENLDYEELEAKGKTIKEINTYNKQGFIRLLDCSDRKDHKELLELLENLV